MVFPFCFGFERLVSPHAEVKKMSGISDFESIAREVRGALGAFFVSSTVFGVGRFFSFLFRVDAY